MRAIRLAVFHLWSVLPMLSAGGAMNTWLTSPQVFNGYDVVVVYMVLGAVIALLLRKP